VPADQTNDALCNVATADSDQTGPDTDDASVPVVAQGTIVTQDVFVPQDTITLSGLTSDASGSLHIALRIDEACTAAGAPAWEYTWTNAGNNVYRTKDIDPLIKAQPAPISSSHDIRWCSEYSGDAHNAPIALGSRGEISHIEFDPTGVLGFGAGALSFAVWSLWNRRRRNQEK